jgi:hypothetical protein
MKKQASVLLMTWSLIATMAVGSAYSQSVEKFLVDIPFGFTVGDKTFPAGQYRVEPIAFSGATLNSKLVIRSTDGDNSAIVSTLPIQASEIQDQSKLIFNLYGDQYFLSQVWTAGNSAGRKLREPRIEVGLAKNLEKRQTVSVIANRR